MKRKIDISDFTLSPPAQIYIQDVCLLRDRGFYNYKVVQTQLFT